MGLCEVFALFSVPMYMPLRWIETYYCLRRQQSHLCLLWNMKNYSGFKGKEIHSCCSCKQRKQSALLFFPSINKYQFLSPFPSLPYGSREVSMCIWVVFLVLYFSDFCQHQFFRELLSYLKVVRPKNYFIPIFCLMSLINASLVQSKPPMA